MAVFQPGEETAQGARSMIADGMVERFPSPIVTLGPARDAISAGRIGAPRRHHALGRGQLGGDAVRSRRPWFDAAEGASIRW